MSDTYKFYNGLRLESLSADPSGPVEGQIQFADGTARTKGLWQYDGSTWVQVPLSAGGTTINTSTKTGAYTLTSSDQNILADATSAAFTLTLPAAASNSGQVYYITKIDSSTNVVTIDGNGSETIDGETTLELGGQYNSVQIISNGTNWFNLSKDKPRTAYVKDVKSNNTDGGTFTSGTFQTRDLNVLTGNQEFISLSSNQFTLEEGVYKVRISAPAYQAGEHKSQLYDITGSTVMSDIDGNLLYGSNARCASGDATASHSFVDGIISITASNVFEIRHRCNTTSATNGFGTANGFSTIEVYTVVEITKIN